MPREPKIGSDKPVNVEQPTVSLRSLLTYENPNAARYAALIQKNQYPPNLSNDFAPGWVTRETPLASKEAVKTYFASKLRGNILVDLGCGREDKSVDAMLWLARYSKAQSYIGVDANYGGGEIEDPFTAIRRDKKRQLDFWVPNTKEKAIPQELTVRAHMLDFISRLPDNSANFAFNGIDPDIIPDNDYLMALMDEFVRATRVGGIVFGKNSEVYFTKKYGKRMRLMNESVGLRIPHKGPAGWSSDMFVYEKVS